MPLLSKKKNNSISSEPQKMAYFYEQRPRAITLEAIGWYGSFWNLSKTFWHSSFEITWIRDRKSQIKLNNFMMDYNSWRNMQYRPYFELKPKPFWYLTLFCSQLLDLETEHCHFFMNKRTITRSICNIGDVDYYQTQKRYFWYLTLWPMVIRLWS